MIRTQIQLSERQLAAVRRAAAEQGTSVAAVIRELVERELLTRQDDGWARALAAVGRFRSGATTTSVDHDSALDDAYRT